MSVDLFGDVMLYRIVNEKNENIFIQNTDPTISAPNKLKSDLTVEIYAMMEKTLPGWNRAGIRLSSKQIFLVSNKGERVDLTKEYLKKIKGMNGKKTSCRFAPTRLIRNLPGEFLDVHTRLMEHMI